MNTLFQIDTGFAVAGFECIDDICIRAAPIIKWFVGKDLAYLQTWARQRGYSLHQV